MFSSHSFSSYLVQVETQELGSRSGLMIDIEAEIVELTQRTREKRKKASRRNVEKLFLRVASTGLLAVGRNKIFAAKQTVFQGDDDEEDNPSSSSRSIVPQLPGEALFHVPASYWLQVMGR